MCVDNVQHPRPKCFASVRPRGLNASLCSIPFLSSRADTNAGELEGETGYRRWGRRRPLHHLHLRSWPLHASDRCSPRPLALLPLRAHACGAALTLLASWVPSECAPIRSGGERPPAACPGLCLSIRPFPNCTCFSTQPAMFPFVSLLQDATSGERLSLGAYQAEFVASAAALRARTFGIPKPSRRLSEPESLSCLPALPPIPHLRLPRCRRGGPKLICAGSPTPDFISTTFPLHLPLICTSFVPRLFRA